ncbi:MAG: reverse transcriptase/maturase family protein [bacterium]
MRDRLLHHAIYRLLYPFFDKIFIPDFFSCRENKGVHKALDRFHIMAYQASKSNHKTCWILKCDIKKFFDSVDHGILLDILQKYIADQDIMWLLNNIISSYSNNNRSKVGLPLGNLTSQLFANVYMNVLDQHVKHKMKIKYYIRYADDFAFFSDNRKQVENLIPEICKFLDEKLNLTVHPDKVFIQTLNSGVDFLGWVHFFNYRTLRKKTRKRMIRRIQQNPVNESLQSYLGLLQHGNTHKIKQELLNDYCLWTDN